MIDNVECALHKACEKTGAQITEYTGAPIFMSENGSGAHEWIFEFSQQPNNLDHFTNIFDDLLKSLNSDYEAKRYNNMTLQKPVVHIELVRFDPGGGIRKGNAVVA